jgi:acyl-CoA thioesterase
VSAERLAAARERAQRNGFWRHLGIEVDEAKEGWVRLRLPLRDELRNAPGAPVHGGVHATLVDAAVGAALGTLHEASAGGVGQTTLDLNVTFLAAPRGDVLFAEGQILRHGRAVAFGEVRIVDARGTLVATGRATYMLLASRAPGS